MHNMSSICEKIISKFSKLFQNYFKIALRAFLHIGFNEIILKYRKSLHSLYNILLLLLLLLLLYYYYIHFSIFQYFNIIDLVAMVLTDLSSNFEIILK